MPDFKVIQWPRDGQPNMPGWFYRDAYSVNKETKLSAGFTNIWKDGRHKFIAGYGGHYPKEVIDFLKKVLRETYLKEHFLLGRGLPSFDLDYDLEYDLRLNIPSSFSGIEQFSGTETIRDLNENEIVGHHTVWCMSLF